jgi:hypothetical protein
MHLGSFFSVDLLLCRIRKISVSARVFFRILNVIVQTVLLSTFSEIFSISFKEKNSYQHIQYNSLNINNKKSN